MCKSPSSYGQWSSGGSWSVPTCTTPGPIFTKSLGVFEHDKLGVSLHQCLDGRWLYLLDELKVCFLGNGRFNGTVTIKSVFRFRMVPKMRICFPKPTSSRHPSRLVYKMAFPTRGADAAVSLRYKVGTDLTVDTVDGPGHRDGIRSQQSSTFMASRTNGCNTCDEHLSNLSTGKANESQPLFLRCTQVEAI